MNAAPRKRPAYWRQERDEILNRLRDAVNAEFGYLSGWPRINLGPCGPFAKQFRQRWNEQLRRPAKIAFIMKADDSECLHVLVKLPNGDFFDGGFGVIDEKDINRNYSDEAIKIRVMEGYDEQRLEMMSYGFNRPYPNCSNYSATLVDELIVKAIRQLYELRQSYTNLPAKPN